MSTDDRQDKELLHLTQRVINLENEVRALNKLGRNNTADINDLQEARKRQIQLNKRFDEATSEPVSQEKPSWLDIFKKKIK